MAKIDAAYFDLSYLDTLARQDTFLHRLDPRIKVLITALLVVCIVSFDKYQISAMLPFTLLLIVAMALARVPLSFVMKKLLIVSPFAVMVGIFNPLFDQQPLLQLGPVAISGGWVSFCSILLRAALTVTTVLLLIACTGFNGVCMALVRLGMPRIFAMQLLMLYRYIFVLVDEGMRMHRARALRSFGRSGLSMKVYSHLVGQLLLRTLDRAQRIHLAMLCRGFDGTIRVRRPLHLTATDLLVLIGSVIIILTMRAIDLPLLLGHSLTGILS